MDVTDILKDAAYIAVGAAILGINKAQVARRDALRRLEPQLVEGRRTVTRWYGQLRENLPLR
jgi:hypothetical protein